MNFLKPIFTINRQINTNKQLNLLIKSLNKNTQLYKYQNNKSNQIYNDIDNPFSSNLGAFQINIQKKKTQVKTEIIQNNVSVIKLKEQYNQMNIQNLKIFEVLQDSTQYSIITEGSSYIIKAENPDNNKQLASVFYSPAMINERNMSLAQAETHIQQLKQKENFEKVKIANINVDSGIKSLRYLKELNQEDIESLHSIDFNQNHSEYMKHMTELNQINNQEILKIVQDDPNNYMRKFKRPFEKQNKFDIIDIESHGTSIKYIEYAVKAAKEGGLIMATFTDLQTLSGPFTEKCTRIYGAQRDRKIAATHETAIRTVLYAIYRIAAMQDKYIEPILSYREDFFIRVHFKVYKSKQILSQSMLNISHMFNCSQCPNFFTRTMGTDIFNSVLQKTIHVPTMIQQDQVKCEVCDSPMHINGPFWTGPIYCQKNVVQINDILQTEQNNIRFQNEDQQNYIMYLLSSIEQESKLQNTQISFSTTQILKFIKAKKLINKDALVRGFKSLGYNITQSYLSSELYKTDAPKKVIFDILKSWKKVVEKNNFNNLQENTPAYKFLIKKIRYQPDFRLINNRNFQFNTNKNNQQPSKPIFSKPEQAYYGPSPKIGKWGKKQ